ncbi:MAG: RluA family pseudouridine synthase [Planctomycetaceae bacterium]|nr:RluA family pseudouridine synthase [Planctomycetaceae bacterium]
MPSPAPQIFRVSPDQVNCTIGAALREWLPGKSWSDVKRLLNSRHVSVSGNLCLDEGRRLKLDEVVKLLPHPAASPPKEVDVRIRYLDPHLVIVEKPAGMTTLRHPEERNWPKRRKQLQPTLDELLPKIIARREVGGQRAKGRAATEHRGRKPPPAPRSKGIPRRLRAVHRIDRETSGLMVFARTVDAERVLGEQFRAHSLQRVYLAVALGHVQEQTIESWLVPDRGDGRRGSTPHHKLGKQAVTHVKPLERLPGFTVLECRLETGRTHQIRIHLSELGHPLCGDKVYRGPFPGKPIADDSGASRVALHAAQLGFDHPITGLPVQFSMPLPADLAALIERLRTRHRRRDSSGTSRIPREPV